jgi:leucyl/phenylalanyl-tRNA--protein transferase
MQKLLRRAPFQLTFDQAFHEVISICQGIPRKGQTGTWILPEMREAYSAFHDAGYAHSVEVWQDDKLVGGIYGVAMGKIFFGESMFSIVNNTSKYALIMLSRFLQAEGFWLIDCQEDTPHIRQMGGVLVKAKDFHDTLARNRMIAPAPGKWTNKRTQLHLP